MPLSILPNCLILDISHWQPARAIDWTKARGSGVCGAIVKLMQNGMPDLGAVDHLRNAGAAGVELLGVYDFGSANEDHQAFLTQALVTLGEGLLPQRLLVIDAEPNPGNQMTVAGMEAWASGVHAATNRWPTVYMGRDGPEGTGRGLPAPGLAKCDLWLPKYGPEPTQANLPLGFRLPTSDTDRGGVLRLWQFTGDGIHPPALWPVGVPRQCDLSVPVGFSTFKALRAWWTS